MTGSWYMGFPRIWLYFFVFQKKKTKNHCLVKLRLAELYTRCFLLYLKSMVVNCFNAYGSTSYYIFRKRVHLYNFNQTGDIPLNICGSLGFVQNFGSSVWGSTFLSSRLSEVCSRVKSRSQWDEKTYILFKLFVNVGCLFFLNIFRSAQ